MLHGQEGTKSVLELGGSKVLGVVGPVLVHARERAEERCTEG